MTEYKDKEVIQKVPVKYICDRCSIESEYEIVELKYEYGYGSKKDGEYIEFDLCEKCLAETIKIMNIKPRVYQNSFKLLKTQKDKK